MSAEVVTPRACYRNQCALFREGLDGIYACDLSEAFDGNSPGDYELSIYDIVPERFDSAAGVTNIVYSAGVISFTIENIESFYGDGAIPFYVGDTLYIISLI